MDNVIKNKRLQKIFKVLKLWPAKVAPDYDNLDFSNWNQTEEEYQQEQRQWLEKRSGRAKKT